MFENNAFESISCIDLSLIFDGKNTITAKAWLDKCYPDSAPSKATVERWFAEFKCGRTDTNDTENSV